MLPNNSNPDNTLPSVKRIIEFQTLLMDWHKRNHRDFPWRKDSTTCYEKIIAEILLQRTKAETVAKMFSKFIACFDSWETLAGANDEEINRYLIPLGLWRRRAVSIKKLAIEMTKRRGIFPKSQEKLQLLPNVGQYIANAILLLCYGEPKPLLDVNMARVLERYFQPRKLVDIRDDPFLQSLAHKILDHVDPIAMNWALLDLSMLICKIKPLSKSCPLAKNCRFAKQYQKLL